jgi:hypothetical protein
MQSGIAGVGTEFPGTAIVVGGSMTVWLAVLLSSTDKHWPGAEPGRWVVPHWLRNSSGFDGVP